MTCCLDEILKKYLLVTQNYLSLFKKGDYSSLDTFFTARKALLDLIGQRCQDEPFSQDTARRLLEAEETLAEVLSSSKSALELEIKELNIIKSRLINTGERYGNDTTSVRKHLLNKKC